MPWRERKCPNFEMVAKDIRTRAPLIASPAFYHCATALDKYIVIPCFPRSSPFSIATHGDLEYGLGKAIRSCYIAVPFQLPLVDYCEQVIMFSYGPLDPAADILISFLHEMLTIFGCFNFNGLSHYR